MYEIREVYNILLKKFGPQGWWPTTPANKTTPKYAGGPKNERQQLEVVFGAILAQNTSWKNAEKAIINLNANNLINACKIIRLPTKKLAKIIKSSGYHNQKTKKLKNFCEFLINNYEGNLKLFFNNAAKNLRNELLSINGIGPETADSIILYAAKKPIFVIDAYTKRIFGRLGYKEEAYDEFQQLFMDNLPKSERLFNEFHALIIELGKNFCKNNPSCGKCPLMAGCPYGKKIK